MTRGQTILVVGAGLTGASLAWLAADRGASVSLISADRPATQSTALASGLARGFGLGGGFASCRELGEDQARVAARRDRRGHELLRRVILESRRSTGYQRCPHLLLADPAATEEELDRVAARLRALGQPVTRSEHGGTPALRREDDAVVHPRRLTFELLHLARLSGASVRLGEVCLGLEPEPGGSGVRAVTSQGERRAERVFWTGGAPPPDQPEPPGTRARIVLHQMLAPGRDGLEWVLQGAAGDLLLAPHPCRRGFTVLARVAEETAAGGLQWPEPPPAWDVYRGPAVRQRLSEVLDAVPGAAPCGAGAICAVGGLSDWPVAAALAACEECVTGAAEATPKPI